MTETEDRIAAYKACVEEYLTAYYGCLEDTPQKYLAESVRYSLLPVANGCAPRWYLSFAGSAAGTGKRPRPLPRRWR